MDYYNFYKVKAIQGGKMKPWKYVFNVFLVCFVGGLFANTAPIVSNVSASQRTDGNKIVDIYYNVSDAEGDTLFVSLEVSNNNGASFTIHPSSANLSGAIGDGIVTGNNKHIIWNAGAEGISYDGNQFRIKVLADDINLTEGLVAYYPFNGNANDATGHGHDGVIHNTTSTQDRLGNPNQAYYFDHSYIEVPNAYELNNLTGNITVCLWVKASLNQDIWDGQYNILDMSHTSEIGWTFQGQPYYSGLAFAVLPTTGDNSLYNQLLFEDSMVLNNQWHMLVGTYSDILMQIFLDGTLIDNSSNLVHPNPPGYGSLYIGGWQGINRSFRGAIDDIRVYNTVLNDSEIQALYHEGGWPLSKQINPNNGEE